MISPTVQGCVNNFMISKTLAKGEVFDETLVSEVQSLSFRPQILSLIKMFCPEPKIQNQT